VRGEPISSHALKGSASADFAKRSASFRIFVAAMLCGMTSVSAQQTQPVFRSGTRLVIETVRVTDKDGRPVEGLTARDFMVTEDGEPQEIAFIEYQRLLDTPLAAATPRPVAPLTADIPSTNQSAITIPSAGDAQFRDRRLVILYFDLSAIPPPDLLRAYDGAMKFVSSQMTAADLLAVMTFGGGTVRIVQDFTDDRARLSDALNGLVFEQDRDGDGVADERDYSSAFGQNDAEFNIFNTDRQLSALQTAMGMLRPLPEQKSLVYFASGVQLNGTDNNAQLRATINAAIRANVTIHPVDARGLVASAPLGDATRRSPGGIGMFSGALAGAAANRFQRSQDTLYALAKDTGGQALFDYNDLSRGIVQAARSQTSYYILGYYSKHTSPDGRFRRVRVSLADGRSANLSYRQGYYADKEFAKLSGAERERQLEEALMLENPVTDVPIALELNHFQLNRAQYFVPVAVKIPGSELTFARRRGQQRLVLDVIMEVKDEAGATYRNIRDKLDIRLTSDSANQLETRAIQYETGFTLLPGKYVIKFLVRDAEAGRIGTYQTPFTIPNLNREDKALPISSVVLSSQRVPLGEALHSVKDSSAALTADPLVHDGQKLIPSVTRVFSQGRDLYVYLQAYERDATDTRPLVAFVTFSRNSQKALETQPVVVTDGLDPRSKAVPLRFSIPLASLAPGRYDCQVTVLDPGGRKVAFWQAPVFVVP
jgi:VWFA-related protein